jgi:phosphate starvation-inducible PhoH-like protein
MHFSILTSDDVVRHTLVAKIVDAYSKHDDAKIAKKAANNEAAQNRIAKKASEK